VDAIDRCALFVREIFQVESLAAALPGFIIPVGHTVKEMPAHKAAGLFRRNN
jgi:hypothetical protein